MNCDRIAPFYEILERLAFGGKLRKHRELYLDAAQGKQRVLILGDGDGRFTRKLIRRFPELRVDSVDISVGMVKQARKRLEESDHVNVICSDAFEFLLKAGRYDLVFTHFFLDCFDTSQVETLAGMIFQAMEAEGLWVISDFREASKGWKRMFTKVWLTTMYSFFRLSTGLTTQRLPDHASALKKAGFRKIQEKTSFADLIASELWQAPATLESSP